MSGSARLHSLRDFQNLYGRLDPTRPIGPGETDWYVERPDAIALGIARNLQLDPQSAHLMVGSIGCGKSTELLAVARHLKKVNKIQARYIEVSEHVDLEWIDAEQLALILLYDLLTELQQWGILFKPPKIVELLRQVEPLVKGTRARDDRDENAKHNAARVVAPALVNPELIDCLRWLKEVREFVESSGYALVLLVDGLDRIPDPIAFDELMEPFLKLLKVAGVGAAIVGPRRVVAGVNRLGVADVFEERHLLRPMDPCFDPGLGFLEQILDARGVVDALSDDVLNDLVFLSGGAVRILLQMTREVIKDAWVRNVEQIGEESVKVAADKMGRSLLLGLTPADIDVLREVERTGRFGARAAEDMALVLTNRILEYTASNGLPHHVVHPTLLPFLKTDAA